MNLAERTPKTQPTIGGSYTASMQTPESFSIIHVIYLEFRHGVHYVRDKNGFTFRARCLPAATSAPYFMMNESDILRPFAQGIRATRAGF